MLNIADVHENGLAARLTNHTVSPGDQGGVLEDEEGPPHNTGRKGREGEVSQGPGTRTPDLGIQ